MAAGGEGPAVDGLERLEDAVADGEPVVEDRDGRVGRRRPATRSARPLRRRPSAPILTRPGGGWRALSSVSSHSSSGSLSQVMPPPVPRWSWPSSTQNVRMATLRSPCCRSASTQPTAPQYTPRGTGSRAAICSRAASFGAPVTEPGRERGARWRPPTRSRAAGGRGRSTPGGRGPGWCSTASSDGHLDGAEVAHPAEVVADEVDDHHVLGPVLGGEAAGVGGGALDRARLDDVAVARQEPLRRRRGHLAAGGRDRAPRRCTAPGCPRPGPRRGRPRRRPRGSGAESRRVRFTWYTSPAAIDARIDRTPAMNSASESELVQASAGGPRHGGPGQGRAGRTLAKRAQIGAPSNGSTTAQNPVESSAAGRR